MSAPNSPKSLPASPTSPSKGKGGSLAPVDFSFRGLTELHDVVYEEPVSGMLAHSPIARGHPALEYLDSLQMPSGKPRPLNSNSVRLCNNQLTTLKGLDRVMPHLLTSPQELSWLDASCNQLASIEEVVTHFPKLQCLYLHGNKIGSMKEVALLAQLKHLRKLTLHGNPISEKGQYKTWVMAHVPQLRCLDFSTISTVDREKASVWHRGHLKHQADRDK